MSAAFYAFSRVCVNAVLRTVWRMRVSGRERVPRTGPLIVAANHVSYFDPPVLGCALPRPLHFMAKKELFAVPLLGAMIRLYNAFPVDRGRGDVGAIKRAVEALKAGNAVLLFPEGTRNREGNGRAQTTFLVLLADRAGHPLDVQKLAPEKFLNAMIASFEGDEQKLAAELKHLVAR